MLVCFDPQLPICGKIPMRTPCTIVAVVKIPALSNSKSGMGEARFDRLLDAVRTAIEPTPQSWGRSNDLLKAANDNGLVWPLVPFPDEWYAAG